jgi:energy-coupling factor transporter ATP-binding protein EcfA2
MGDIIVVQDLVKNYGDFCAVNHISFTVPEGTIFGFLGPNGAGKTTTIKMLTTVLGRVLGGTIVAMMQGAVVFLVCLVFGFRFGSWLLLPLALVFMFLISLLFTSIGTAIGSVLQDMAGLPAGHEFFGDAALLLFRRALPDQWAAESSDAGASSESPYLRRRRPARRSWPRLCL